MDSQHGANGFELPLQFFDPREEYVVAERRLPHWSQAGAICFITFRTHDSMPAHVVETWMEERSRWLQRNGIDTERADWQARLQELPKELIRSFQEFVSERWSEHLDALHGECVLRQPALAAMVGKSLRHFDGIRYVLSDFVVMPNHVHLLAAFPSEEAMLAQCESWKHYTAHEINRALRSSGRFWQQDAFDHLVRSLEQFEYLRRYIAENPIKAKLRPGEYLHESRGPFNVRRHPGGR